MKERIIHLFQTVIVSLAVVLLLASASAAQRPQMIKPIPDGYTLIDGDMVMPTWFADAVIHGRTPEATYRTNLWPGGIVPYEFQTYNAPASDCPDTTSGQVSIEDQQTMRDRMKAIEDISGVDFQECRLGCNARGIANYIRIRDSTSDIVPDDANNCVSGAGNNSRVGMVGGPQILNLVDWNDEDAPFIPVHELVHALGIFHEQSRPDRGGYVTINCSNVMGGCSGKTFTSNFTIPGDAIAYGYYDFDSLMHYGQCAFSVGSNCPADGTRTVIVNAPWDTQWQNKIGQLTHLSTLDQATISFLYPFIGWVFFDCTYNSSRGSPNGSFIQPYPSIYDAIAHTPSGGTLWILQNCRMPAGLYTANNVTIRTAPGVMATFGGD